MERPVNEQAVAYLYADIIGMCIPYLCSSMGTGMAAQGHPTAEECWLPWSLPQARHNALRE